MIVGQSRNVYLPEADLGLLRGRSHSTLYSQVQARPGAGGGHLGGPGRGYQGAQRFESAAVGLGGCTRRSEASRHLGCGAGHFESMGRFEQIARSAESLDDPSRRLTLRRAVEFFKDAGAAPVIIIPCLVNVSSPTDDPQQLLAGSSIYGAVQNMMLAARAKGIGTVLTTFQPMIDGTLRERLGIPPEAVPTCIVPMGYPDEQRFGPHDSEARRNRRPLGCMGGLREPRRVTLKVLPQLT